MRIINLMDPVQFSTPEDVGAKLLLCDDSPIERLALAHYLRAAGYKVDEAADGNSALQFLKHRRVDLLLLDLEMPDTDGFDVLNYLDEHRRGLPVILLTGMNPDLIQGKMYSLRSHSLPPLLIKPIDPEQLVEVVEMQLTGQLPDPAEAPDAPEPHS